MSEKRRRQQQRRQTRKADSGPRRGGSRPRGGAGRSRPSRGEIERELAEMLGTMAELAVAGAGEPSDALDAEQWVSGLVGTWQTGPVADPDADRLFGPGLVLALEHLGGSGALIVLRALTAIGDEAYASLAREAADRLDGAGVTGPSWLEGLGRAKPGAALLMCDDDGFDDGLSVLVEFATPGAEPYTLGIYIDHNMGGLVKDVFIAGPLASVREQLERSAPDKDRLALRALDLADARARVQDALEIFDRTLAPPVDEDVRSLRAFMRARIATLPEGGAGAGDEPEVTDLVNDPDAWGPAKAFAMAAQQAGVDLSDPDAVDAFVELQNEGLTT